MSEVGLADAIERVCDAVVGAIDAGIRPKGELPDVAAVVRGDRSRPQPKMPCVWVVPDQATCDNTATGLREQWTLLVRIAALVVSDDPDKGGRDAVRFAAIARSLTLRDRRLGLPFVNSVKSFRFDASPRVAERNRNLYWADATVQVTFQVREDA